MNPVRHQNALSNLQTIARKTYDCVPLQEAWTILQIHAHMRRTNTGIDMHTARGCISALQEAGLVKEVSNGKYRRVLVRAPKPSKETSVPLEKTTDPLSRLADAAQLLRNLANTLDEIALDVVQTKSSNDEELEKLRTLKTLLKGL